MERLTEAQLRDLEHADRYDEGTLAHRNEDRRVLIAEVRASWKAEKEARNLLAALEESMDRMIESRVEQRMADREREAIPLILSCPCCGERHIDRGEFATKVHHTHACQHCGVCWRPAVVPTVGVQFLPGFRDSDKEGG